MGDKIIGYLLLVVGLVIIVFTLLNIFGLFTGKTTPASIFDLPGIEVDLGQSYEVSLPPDMEAAGVKVQQPQSNKQELLPGVTLTQTTNFFAHLVILGFISSAGFKIARLGTQLIRPIIVKSSRAEDLVKSKKPKGTVTQETLAPKPQKG